MLPDRTQQEFDGQPPHLEGNAPDPERCARRFDERKISDSANYFRLAIVDLRGIE
jgi:hypothetical protein